MTTSEDLDTAIEEAVPLYDAITDVVDGADTNAVCIALGLMARALYLGHVPSDAPAIDNGVECTIENILELIASVALSGDIKMGRTMNS